MAKRPATILIIEDNAANLELMSYLLISFGYTVQTAANGTDGLDQAQRLRPDAVLCDVQLPGLDGWQIARRMKADPQLCGVPLVAVTALAMVGDRDRMIAAGFDGYLDKPIDPERFVTQVEAFLPAPRRTARRTGAAAR